jgi:hypothetical protein
VNDRRSGGRCSPRPPVPSCSLPWWPTLALLAAARLPSARPLKNWGAPGHRVEAPPPARRTPAIEWDEFVGGYRAGLIKWNTARLGPKPGEPGCRAPAEVLREHRFRPHHASRDRRSAQKSRRHRGNDRCGGQGEWGIAKLPTAPEGSAAPVCRWAGAPARSSRDRNRSPSPVSRRSIGRIVHPSASTSSRQRITASDSSESPTHNLQGNSGNGSLLTPSASSRSHP